MRTCAIGDAAGPGPAVMRSRAVVFHATLEVASQNFVADVTVSCHVGYACNDQNG